VAVAGAGAQALSVSYLEGDVQTRDGSAWSVLSIGDRLAPQASIRLDAGAYLELSGPGIRIALNEQGIYALRDIVASARTLGSAGVGTAISSALSRLAHGPVRLPSAVSGVRGEVMIAPEDFAWVTVDVQERLETGKRDLADGDAEEAIAQFLIARDAATNDEMPQVSYYLALAYSLKGDTRAALKCAAGIQPHGADEWAPDFVILKAKLLIDTNAFTQCVAWLTERDNDLSEDSQRAALYHFLLGVGYRGMGNVSSAKASLSKVVAISGESEVGKSAAQLLQAP
jgi:hypothetical protein